MNHEELVGALKQLRLNAMANQYVETARIAEASKKTFEQYLGLLAKTELAEKHQLKVQRLIREAKLPQLKSFESYDFNIRTGVSSQQMERLSEGNWLKKAGNVVLYGSFGLGKSHLAMALLRRLCENGYRCLWITTHELIEKLRDNV